MNGVQGVESSNLFIPTNWKIRDLRENVSPFFCNLRPAVHPSALRNGAVHFITGSRLLPRSRAPRRTAVISRDTGTAAGQNLLLLRMHAQEQSTGPWLITHRKGQRIRESQRPAPVTGLCPEQPEKRKRQARCLIRRACRIQKAAETLRPFGKRRYRLLCSGRVRGSGIQRILLLSAGDFLAAALFRIPDAVVLVEDGHNEAENPCCIRRPLPS